MTITITRDAALEALAAAVTERGEDFIYRRPGGTCVYVNPEDGTPSCLVGDALHRLGVPNDVLLTLDADDTAIGQVRAFSVLKRAGVDVAEDALYAFAAAQREQDFGATWGHALSVAREPGPVAA